MWRKILTGALLVISSALLILSVIGIAAAWFYNEPLTRESTARVQKVESTLAQIQSDLQNAKAEVERALRLIESAEQSMAALSGQTSGAQNPLAEVSATLDSQLIPSLKSSRENISQLRVTLVDLHSTIDQLNALPLLNLNLPGSDVLTAILSNMDSLDSGLADVQDIAQRASTFIGDTSYLLGGDFSESKQNLQNLGLALDEYNRRITDWRAQAATIRESLPGWMDRASLLLTVFLLWFGLSQFGLLLHGLTLWHGGDPLEGWKKMVARVKGK